MADEDIWSLSLEELTEELTIQQVVLDSLLEVATENGRAEELEEDVNIATARLTALKKRMRALQEESHASLQTERPSLSQQTSHYPPRSTVKSEEEMGVKKEERGEEREEVDGQITLPRLSDWFGPAYSDFSHEPRQPTFPRSHTTAMATSGEGDPPPNGPSSVFPPLTTRKRPASTASIDGQHIRRSLIKSRRRSPSSDDDPFATPLAESDSEIDTDFAIDLTGVETTEDMEHLVQQQRREENRIAQLREQAERDRLFALQLQNGMISAASSAPSSPLPHQLNSSQYGGSLGRQYGAHLQSGGTSGHLSPAPGMQRAEMLGMPGGWRSEFDLTSGPGSQGLPTSYHHSTNSGLASYLPPLSLGSLGDGFSTFANGDPASRNSSSAMPLFSFPQPMHLGVGSGELGSLRNPLLTAAVPDRSLSSIISRTNGYDFSAGVDAYGRPLPERIRNYVNDVMDNPRNTNQDIQNLLENLQPDMEIPKENREGTPDALKYPLMEHQKVALTWMSKAEGTSKKGGILADAMGLGKTISALALMVSRKATSGPKTNLVVAPVGLLRQWEEEIMHKLKSEHALTVFIYHNKKCDVDTLASFDVVITTYGTVSRDLKKLEQFMAIHRGVNVDWRNDKVLAATCPLLHPRATFHRIILDEAQYIKNEKTKQAAGCRSLKASFRWCLTGTPMMNGVQELFSLIQFLRIQPYNDASSFKQNFGCFFGKPGGELKPAAMRRLRALLTAIMLRRTKSTKIDGQPILTLPEKTVKVVRVHMNDEERDFYSALEAHSRVQVSAYLREGTMGQNYTNILVLLLRLRQACCHPHLHVDVDERPEFGDVDPVKMVEFAGKLEQSVVDRIKAANGEFECPICYDAVLAPILFFPCGHDSCVSCLVRLFENAAQASIRAGEENGNITKCPSCRREVDRSKIIPYSIFEKVHMPKKNEDEDDEEEEEEEVGMPSKSEADSGTAVVGEDDVDEHGNLKDFVVADEVESGDGEGSSSSKTKAKVKARALKKQKQKNKAAKAKEAMDALMGPCTVRTLKYFRQEGTKNRVKRQAYMNYLDENWLPSSKSDACIKLLEEIQESGEKTIVFSQWTMLLDLLEVAFKKSEKLKETQYHRYDGGMSRAQRQDAVLRFKTSEDVKILLVSLRAGNAGLNLTCASRVIIMDPFWNPYIEDQAVDRAHRIGQHRPVQVYRILTTGTVEDRIIEIQDAKRAVVGGALDEGEMRAIGRLSNSEIANLIGLR